MKMKISFDVDVDIHYVKGGGEGKYKVKVLRLFKDGAEAERVWKGLNFAFFARFAKKCENAVNRLIGRLFNKN